MMYSGIVLMIIDNMAYDTLDCADSVDGAMYMDLVDCVDSGPSQWTADCVDSGPSQWTADCVDSGPSNIYSFDSGQSHIRSFESDPIRVLGKDVADSVTPTLADTQLDAVVGHQSFDGCWHSSENLLKTLRVNSNKCSQLKPADVQVSDNPHHVKVFQALITITSLITCTV